jgi:hypothetical protein
MHFSFSEDEWQELGKHYLFDRDKRGGTGSARTFLTAAVQNYCREAVLGIRKSEVKATLRSVVLAFRRIQEKVDNLEALNDWKQAISSVTILRDGPSGQKLHTERFDEYRNFVQLLEGCLEEMPKIQTGPKDQSIPLLLTEIQKTLQHMAVNGGLSPNDPRWKGPKANQRFLAAIMKASNRVTDANVLDVKINEELHRFITRLNRGQVSR